MIRSSEKRWYQPLARVVLSGLFFLFTLLLPVCAGFVLVSVLAEAEEELPVIDSVSLLLMVIVAWVILLIATRRMRR